MKGLEVKFYCKMGERLFIYKLIKYGYEQIANGFMDSRTGLFYLGICNG